MNYDLITILGPTATGKTKLAARLAFRFNGEIISADSRQVYKGMDIGTGKDLDDYTVEGSDINYHLIDIIDPEREFNLFIFKENFFKALDKITSSGNLPFMVGGTGMYLSSILQNYDLKKAAFDKKQHDILAAKPIEDLRDILIKLKPEIHNTTDLLEKERLIKAILIEQSPETGIGETRNINSFNIGIRLDREIIKDRITGRLKLRLKNGMIEEVENLIANGLTFDKLNFFGLEYKFVGLYLKGELNYNDMYQKLNSAIHSFAKRQMTWFRKMEREGVKIHWLNGPDYDTAVQLIEKAFN